jgi:predicted DNA-binding transcriptional regulator AlpA
LRQSARLFFQFQISSPPLLFQAGNFPPQKPLTFSDSISLPFQTFPNTSCLSAFLWSMFQVEQQQPKDSNMEDQLLTTKQVADYLGISAYTLVQYRVDGDGPEYIKIGHLVRYQMSDIAKWLKSKKS